MISIALSDLGIAFILCLVVSALGFRRVDYFISIGYGFSIAAQALLFAALHWSALGVWSAGQSVLLLAYGLRLGLFLLGRERAPSFGREQEASLQRSARVKGIYKIVIWVAVSALYVAMFSPALFTLNAGASTVGAWLLPVGVVIMLAGLVLEAMADRQKSAFKATNPSAFCDVRLFRVVRSPNYLGEMVFWGGTWISGIPAYRAPLDWLLSLAGLVCIELIMLGSARRLELKQAERYGGRPEYDRYARQVPILFPFIPLYSLKRLRIYLG